MSSDEEVRLDIGQLVASREETSTPSSQPDDRTPLLLSSRIKRHSKKLKVPRKKEEPSSFQRLVGSEDDDVEPEPLSMEEGGGDAETDAPPEEPEVFERIDEEHSINAPEPNEENEEVEKRKNIRHAKVLCSVAGALVMVAFIVATCLFFFVFRHPHRSVDSPQAFASKMNQQNIYDTLASLMVVARNFSESRSVAKGWGASAQVIESALRGLRHNTFTVTRQNFIAPVWSLTYSAFSLNMSGSSFVSFVEGVDYTTIRNCGGTNKTSAPVKLLAQSGCNSSVFTNVTGSIVALEDSSLCSYHDVVLAAQTMGALGVIFYPTSSGAPLSQTFISLNATLSGASVLQIPAISISWVMKELLVVQRIATLQTHVSWSYVPTYNIIASTNMSSTSPVLVFGSHLDSDATSPGINDNASGAATLLEVAAEMDENPFPLATDVMFVWFSASALGALGSSSFIAASQSIPIAAYIDVARLASPNYEFLVYNSSLAQGLSRTRAMVGDEGNISMVLTEAFTSYFSYLQQSTNISYQFTPFFLNTTNDYVPFIATDIPSAGITAGGSILTKSVSGRSLFGGLANVALDPCQHLACDTIDNVSRTSLKVTSEAVGYALYTLAVQTNNAVFQRDLLRRGRQTLKRGSDL